MPEFKAARTAMVDRQVRPSDVTRFAIIEAMLWAPRERFVPRAKREVAYADAPIEIARGRALIEARTFAKMIEAAEITGDDLVLDVGAGYGYGAAVMSRMAAAVIALECDAALAKAARETLPDIDVDNVVVEEGPLEAGAAGSGPFDAIMIAGGIATAPTALLEQLKDGGRLVAIDVDGRHGRAKLWRKTGDAVTAVRIFDATAPVLPGFDAAPAFEF